MAGVHRVRWMYHATAIVGDYERARDWLIAYCGARVLHDNVIREPGIDRRGGVIWIGDNGLELDEPLGVNTGTTRYLERFGPGVSSLALQVANLDATIASFDERGVRLAARPLPTFCFSDARTTEGILLEWSDGSPGDDPRFGATLPPLQRPPLLEVRRMAFVGAVVSEPQAVAKRLAHLFGTAVTFEHAGAGLDEPEAGVSVGDCTLALYRLPDATEAIRLWGRPLARAQTHMLAFTVSDLDAAAAVFRGQGTGLLRRTAGFLLPRPSESGDITIAFTDSLLPNDPRRDAA